MQSHINQILLEFSNPFPSARPAARPLHWSKTFPRNLPHQFSSPGGLAYSFLNATLPVLYMLYVYIKFSHYPMGMASETETFVPIHIAYMYYVCMYVCI
jgi:hypothetical protein